MVYACSYVCVCVRTCVLRVWVCVYICHMGAGVCVCHACASAGFTIHSSAILALLRYLLR